MDDVGWRVCNMLDGGPAGNVLPQKCTFGAICKDATPHATPSQLRQATFIKEFCKKNVHMRPQNEFNRLKP